MRWVTIFSTPTAADQAFEKKPLRRVVIGENAICLARTQGEYFAIADACPHQKVPLSTGHLNENAEVVCPLHSYRYCLKTGREYLEFTEDAEVYPLRWHEGALQIGLV